MNFSVRPSMILESLPSTRAGIELENAWNQFLVRTPQVRQLLYRPWASSGGDSSVEAGHESHNILPSIHYRAGMGHRVSSWISAFLVARDNGLGLVRLPWRDGWDTWLGLDTDPLWSPGMGRVKLLPPVARDNDARGAALFARIIESRPPGRVTYRLAQDHFTRDQSGAFAEMATRYWRLHDRAAGRRVRISVHVRRGDVTATVNERRFRGLGYFERQLSAVTSYLDELSLPWEGVIHTQGSAREMRALLGGDHVGGGSLRLSGAAAEVEDFHAMCCSDILIASPSSFSVTAGMISGGLVMRPREWFHTMPGGERWVGVEDDGAFDESALRRAIRLVTSNVLG